MTSDPGSFGKTADHALDWELREQPQHKVVRRRRSEGAPRPPAPLHGQLQECFQLLSLWQECSAVPSSEASCSFPDKVRWPPVPCRRHRDSSAPAALSCPASRGSC